MNRENQLIQSALIVVALSLVAAVSAAAAHTRIHFLLHSLSSSYTFNT